MKLTLGLAVAAMKISAPANAAALSDAIRGDMPELMTLYRDLHANPELSMQEHRTAGIAEKHLRDNGYEVTGGVGETGVIGLLRPSSPYAYRGRRRA